MGPVDSMPLSDLVVLDLTIARAGPTAVRQLADWGADVIRIEPRHIATTGAGHHTPDYLNLHRNKRSLSLDLKRDEGRTLLHRFVEKADVLVENMRPAVKHRLGFDWQTVSAINPRIIMGSISGFGQDGPYADRGGVDQIAQGLGGMMSVTGLPGQGPVRAGVAISDVTAGLQLAVGILVSLHERERTGRGRYVHTSLLESMIGMLDFQAARWTVARETPPQAGNHHPTLGPMGLYETRDGHMNLAAPWGRIWRTFCDVIGRPDLQHDVRFAGPEDRTRNREALNREITDALRARTTEEWVEILKIPRFSIFTLQRPSPIQRLAPSKSFATRRPSRVFLERSDGRRPKRASIPTRSCDNSVSPTQISTNYDRTKSSDRANSRARSASSLSA